MRGTVLAAAIMFLCSSHTAFAGPWTRDSGSGYWQTAILGQRIDGADAVRGELYGEYGLTQKWTVTSQLEGVKFTQIDGFDQFAYRITGRRKFWSNGRWLAAFEGGVVGGEAIGGTIGGCDTVGGEARISIGGGGVTKRERNWFTFLDGAVREHGNCRRQRIEAGYGQEVFKNWFAINKIFLEEGSGDARSIKVESTLSKRIKSLDFGVGYRQEVGGRFNEIGLIISVERRF